MKRNLSVAVAASALLLSGAAVAQTTNTSVDLSPFWGNLMPYLAAAVGAVISFLVGWVLVLLKSKLGLSIDDSMRSSLQTAATNAAGLLLNRLGNVLPGSVDVHNEPLADFVNYVIKASPDAVKYFNLTPADIEQKILALLPQVANTTTSATAPSA